MDRVTVADLPEVIAYLRGRIEHAMFPLANLADFGLDGDHPYAPRMWATWRAGKVASVLTVTRNGSVMPNCPAHEAATALSGQQVSALIGPAGHCRPLHAALGLDCHARTVDEDDPHFAMPLDALQVPCGVGRLVPLEKADPDEMIAWRTAFEVEALGQPPAKAAQNGRRSYDGYIARDSHAVLVEGDTPLATTGFNARLPEIVQVGGVYTPPPLRGRGHARRAVALHLSGARATGTARATLFASGPPAVRAYEAIGFRRIGSWTLCLMKEPVHV